MNTVDELMKLKELLDSGLITQEEFMQQKEEILKKGVEIKEIKSTSNEELNNENLVNETNKEFENTKAFLNNNNYNYNKKKKKPSGCMIAVIIYIVFIAVIIISVFNIGSQVGNIRYKLFEQYNISAESVDGIIQIIDNCGYSKYFNGYKISKGIDNDEIEGSIGFELTQGDRTIGFVDVKDGKVCAIQYSDKMLVEDGVIKHTLDEYLITSSEETELIINTESVIRKILKSPSTAKFPWDYNEWKIGKKDGKTIVQGYVDSQNGFGAMVRSQFQVEYTNGSVTSIIFDGEKVL